MIAVLRGSPTPAPGTPKRLIDQQAVPKVVAGPSPSPHSIRLEAWRQVTVDILVLLADGSKTALSESLRSRVRVRQPELRAVIVQRRAPAGEVGQRTTDDLPEGGGMVALMQVR
jgi:hypothetical protein